MSIPNWGRTGFSFFLLRTAHAVTVGRHSCGLLVRPRDPTRSARNALRVATHHSLKYLFGDFCALRLKLEMLLSAQRCACAQVAALAALASRNLGRQEALSMA